MKHEQIQRRKWIIAMAVTAALGVVASLAGEYKNYRCEQTPDHWSGECSGRPGPSGCGSRNRVQYQGCHDCIEAQGETCTRFPQPMACLKRTQVIPCITNEAGYSIEGDAGPFGPWQSTLEDYCESPGD